MPYQSLKGFHDILPAEAAEWRWMESVVSDMMRRYGFGEVRLPILEQADLFARGIGQDTDVIGKEMYVFPDRSTPPEHLALRPELTAGAARAYVEHSVAQIEPITKWYYVGPSFRYEQPQAGRQRQFHTVGVELIGAPTPEADVEVITLGVDLLTSLGISNFRLRVNSLGVPAERVAYRAILREYLLAHENKLSEESKRRIDTNPLRVLDSKDERDKDVVAGAPALFDSLDTESREHFSVVQRLLTSSGVRFDVDTTLVRGLDYYTRTVFEFQGLDLGAQDALGGGGRYDGLIEEVGGKSTPATGFGFGMERLLISVKASNQDAELFPIRVLDVYVVALDDASRVWAAGIVRTLRGTSLQSGAHISAEYDLLRRSMKAQMREANRKQARLTVIVGSQELESRTAQLKNMGTSEQTQVSFDDLLASIVSQLQTS